MKALYIIAWVGLVLSIIVHVLSILGPEDVFWGVDGFVWMLHGGCILLGLPAILCVQKLTLGTKERGLGEVFSKSCPLWMGGMVGFFVFYGIINFIVFMTKSEATVHGHGTPASIFKGFSGHWMIFYSIEVAIFHSYLKERFSRASKNSLSDQILPMDGNSRQQYDLSREQLQTKRNKYSQIIRLFLIVGGVFSILLWLAFKGYPWFLGCAVFSLFPFAVIHVIYLIYWNWKVNSYLRENHFEIWKKGKSPSLSDRLESSRLVKKLDDPYLKSLNFKVTRFSEICFWVWLILLGLVLTGLAILQWYVQSK